MMAFKPPPELKNRIENIKKKFEVIEHSNIKVNADNLLVPVNENGLPIQPHFSKNEQCCSENKNEVAVGETGSHTCTRVKLASSSMPGKGNIRRSPAFRFEKTTSHQSANVSKKACSVVNNRVRMFETKQHSTSDKILPCNNIREETLSHEQSTEQASLYVGDVLPVKPDVFKNHRSNSLDKLSLKLSNNLGSSEKINSCTDLSVSENSDPSLIKNKLVPDFANCEGDIILKPHLVALDKKSCWKDLGTITEERSKSFTRQISNDVPKCFKTAMQAPLPPGPPPKKPPRTFAHRSPDVTVKTKTIHCSSNKFEVGSIDSIGNNLHTKLTRDKKTLEPHLMLEKLENMLLKHQQGIGNVVSKPVLDSKFSTENQTSKGEDGKNSVLSLNFPVSDTPVSNEQKKMKFGENRLGGCFESLNCAANSHFYEKLNEKQSEFFVPSYLDSEKKVVDIGNKVSPVEDGNNAIEKAFVKEHIYAEPYACIDIETILRAELAKKRDSKEMSEITDMHIKNNQATLHYMCSPINALDRIDALLNGIHVNNVRANNDDLNSKLLSLEERKNYVPDAHQNKSGDKLFAQKYLQFSSVPKNQQFSPANLVSPKLDRSKVQLFINQAFGSPLHGAPITPLDSISSDESTSTTPDEMNPTSFDDCEGSSEQRTKEEDEVSAHESESSVDNFHDKRKDMSKLTEERKVYVRRVSSRIFSTRQRIPSRPFTHLYHCIMLIGLNLDGEKKTKVPYVKSKYPPSAPIPPMMEHLCFPDSAEWPPAKNLRSHIDEQSYSLVITNESGDHMFGYCRRVMPEGTDICLPLAYCILSPVRAKGFYLKILAELESQHGQPEWCQKAFIKELYACEFPNPGQSLKLPSTIKDVPGSVEKLLTSLAAQLRRPLDSRLEEFDLTLLFSTLTVPILIQVFACILLERKVLFFSNSLSKLSSCIEALHSILYPFSWQYTFIPVLPSAQIGVCEAPTPFIIGLLKDKEGKVPAMLIEEGIVVDLEQPKILQCVGDEATILPPRLKKCLKMALQLVESTTEHSEPARNVLISEAFIRMFVEMCGHYSNHLVMQQDGKKVFERESFIKSVPSQSVQLFLEWFTETAMFTIFIESRLEEGTDNKGLFEQRAMEHGEEMDKNTMLFLRNYKALNKKVKSFGDRLKDWTPFT